MLTNIFAKRTGDFLIQCQFVDYRKILAAYSNFLKNKFIDFKFASKLILISNVNHFFFNI